VQGAFKADLYSKDGAPRHMSSACAGSENAVTRHHCEASSSLARIVAVTNGFPAFEVRCSGARKSWLLDATLSRLVRGRPTANFLAFLIHKPHSGRKYPPE